MGTIFRGKHPLLLTRIQVSDSGPMGTLVLTNTEWENPTAHGTCSYIDSSGYASGPIRRCLVIDYIINTDINEITILKDFKNAPPA